MADHPCPGLAVTLEALLGVQALLDRSSLTGAPVTVDELANARQRLLRALQAGEYLTTADLVEGVESHTDLEVLQLDPTPEAELPDDSGVLPTDRLLSEWKEVGLVMDAPLGRVA